MSFKESFLSEEMIQRLHDFEENCFYKYSYDQDLVIKERMEEKVNNASEKIENINSRIDDIFFKENITKASLYKVELRLQKLEEISYETIRQLTQLNKRLCNSSLEANATTGESFDWRIPMKQKVLRQRSITVSGDGLKDSHRSSIYNSNNKSTSGLKQTKTSESDKAEGGNSTGSAAPIDSNDNFDLKNLNAWNLSFGSSLNESHEQHDEQEDDLAEELINQQSIMQQQSGIDQYTLHPFVYLHSVVKPPLAEYTSITDSIDTSNIDRPPSPQLTQNPSGITLNKVKIHKKNYKAKDYCALETTRSAVARQESEILRLAEESQHVIINQMLNKLVKQTSVDMGTDSNNMSIENINEENQDVPTELSNNVITEDETKPFTGKSFKKSKLAPLSGMERNFSQIFFAQTQASALISHVEEEIDEQDDAKSTTFKFN